MKLLLQNSFVLTLLLLCLLCFALHEAKADVKGIPFSQDFAEAEFPYARVATSCQGWHKPTSFGAAQDEWGAVGFSGACVELDRCYHTLGQSWGECNRRFHDDLRNACDRDLKAAQLEKANAAEMGARPDDQALTLCYKIADLYVARAQQKDTPRFFDEAQKTQRAYLDFVRKVVDQTYRSVLKRPATQKEALRALASLAQGYTLDDLKASLMGARIDQDRDAEVLPALVPDEELNP